MKQVVFKVSSEKRKDCDCESSESTEKLMTDKLLSSEDDTMEYKTQNALCTAKSFKSFPILVTERWARS